MKSTKKIKYKHPIGSVSIKIDSNIGFVFISRLTECKNMNSPTISHMTAVIETSSSQPPCLYVLATALANNLNNRRDASNSQKK